MHCWEDGFLRRGKMIMELVRWIASVFREIDERAIDAVVRGKLSVSDNPV